MSAQIEAVRYSMLTSMLLNELQKQTKKNEQQAEKIARLEERLSTIEHVAAKDQQSLSAERRRQSAVSVLRRHRMFKLGQAFL